MTKSVRESVDYQNTPLQNKLLSSIINQSQLNKKKKSVRLKKREVTLIKHQPPTLFQPKRMSSKVLLPQNLDLTGITSEISDYGLNKG